MALVNVAPIRAHLDWHPAEDRPVRVRFGRRDLRIARLTAVRDERAAFPRSSGPTISFVLEAAGGGQARVVFDARRRAWFVNALDPAA